ncbi:glycosyltransferase involved in cell wall biosynthesis [Mariniflexile fucanivorans]|uniref:Glycosyltransferase involved in cell wall biosynthesis n=1 Tax=Mariniflexile fucanivorans TaxID=264023 RepID=A0A4R1RDF1_9FLAO|nr:glycosyltransferase family 2 protein [Mariniflexile fucanivorans]TCL63881.1 glycosyltransferase involved in cell wall biosynthesis [Mariniflexile fucanivorans]
MQQPLVSIIIPTYNRARFIGETLDSVLAQTHLNWECIVVDDGSTDNTAEILEKYIEKDSRFQYHLRPTNYAKGGNGARNYGLDISNGEFVNWIDDDDIMDINKLSIQIASLLKSDFKFSICQTLNFKYELVDFYGLRPENECLKDPFEAYLKEEFVVFTPSTLWNKSFLVERNYKFNESLKASQEWEFYCNVFYNDKIFCFVEKPLVYIRYHDQRITTKKPSQKFWHYYLARFIIYKKYYKKLPLEIQKYLVNYFISIYKTLLKRKEYIKSLKIFFVVFFAKTLNLKMKFFLIMSLFSFIFFKRGEFFINRIKL